MSKKIAIGLFISWALIFFPAAIPVAQVMERPAMPTPTPLPNIMETKPAPSPETPGKVIKLDGEKYVGLNFDYADINVVIQTIAELIDLNYILSPGVSGKVTIQTSGKIALEDLIFVLEKILEVNNLAAVKSDDFYKIIPTGSVRQEALETIGPEEDLPPGEGMVIKIFSLRYTSPSEIVRILNPLKSPQGIFAPYDPSNILFILDSSSRIRMFSGIIETLDVDTYQDIEVALYPVNNAQAEDLAKDLTDVIATITAAQGKTRTRFKLIPIESINSLLFVSGEPSLGALLKNWIKQLDQPATTEAEKIFVYNCSHASAENLSSILREIYSKESESPSVTTSAPARETERGELPVMKAEAGESQVSGRVKIVADKDTNSLIIQTAPWNYPAILETIKKLDTIPKQVLIEVTVAEITLDDENQFGIEWALKSQGNLSVGGEALAYESLSQNVYNSSGIPAQSVPGFSFMLAEASRLTAVLNAYAQASKLNIIASPHIIASNNKEARIDIGEEVPIVTSETVSEEGTQTDQTIEYRDTGIILTVTPHINEERFVTLDVAQEISEAQTNLLGGTDSPIIRKRKAETSMVVKDNQTLIIGGLMSEKEERSREGIPFLSRIPILGYLFGKTVDTVSKTDLIILITPRVITNAEEGSEVTEDYKGRSIILKEGGKEKWD